MDLIFDLPQELQESIICEWLSDNSTSIGRLDSAYCNKKLRPDLLHILKSTCVLPTLSTDETWLIDWVFQRNVRVRDITLVSDKLKDMDFIGALLIQIGAVVTSISFELDVSEETYAHQNSDPFKIPPYVCSLIPKYCVKLRCIRFEDAIVDPALFEIITHSTQLKEIHFKGARGLTTDILKVFCAVPSLEVLNLTQAGGFGISPDLVFTPEDPIMHNLRTLLVSGTNLSFVTNMALVKQAPNLTEISMRLGGDLGIAYVASHCPKLVKCTLTRVPLITATTAAVLCKTWTAIQYLALYNNTPSVGGTNEVVTCTEDALIMLIQQCRSLQRLKTIYSVSNFSRDDLSYSLVDTSSSVSQLVDLQIGSVTSATLERICRACPNLYALHLYYKPPSEANEQAVMAEDALHLLEQTSITTLVLEQTRLNDDQLLSIQDMTHLYLLDCRGIFTTQGLADMALINPDLATLCLYNAPERITYRVIRAVLSNCPKMTIFAYAIRDAYHSDSPVHHALKEMIHELYPQLHQLILSF